MNTENRTIYALGFFDGVHLGHQALLAACRELAAKHSCKTGAVTFASHPDALVTGKAPALLNTIEERKALLHSYGMEDVIVLPFDRALMTTHWSVFLQQLVNAGAAGFVCGSDFRFGAGGSGTARKLRGFCESRQLPCAVVPQQELEGIRVSSTYIRELVTAGEMERAAKFLGRPHILTGTVISGRGLGHTLGVPTANISLSPEIVCPSLGVYACKAFADGKPYLAVTNIGTRPTVDGHHITVEPWLLDFEGDLYGKPLYLAFYQFLRPEQKFDSLEQLQAEIQKNAAQTRKILENS